MDGAAQALLMRRRCYAISSRIFLAEDPAFFRLPQRNLGVKLLHSAEATRLVRRFPARLARRCDHDFSARLAANFRSNREHARRS